jgi:lipoprotein-anchoring transpeptidase ErfK/SrfK
MATRMLLPSVKFLLLPMALAVPGLAAKAGREPLPEIDAAAINTPQNVATSPGDLGPAVVRVQILLDRAHFSCGQIDGNYGSNLQKAVSAFQRSRNLPVNGIVGPETWVILNQDTAPAVMPYTIDQQDVAGPFVKLPTSMMQQAKLPYVGYASPQDELAEKFHSSPELLTALNPGKDLAKAGDQIEVPNAITMPPGEAALVVVSKDDSSVTALDAQGHILAYYVATIGSVHDPLPIGNWTIKGVARNPFFHYNPKLFWDAKSKNMKATIRPGPRNPVGVVWIQLSKEHYGIHGTPAPSRIGHTESHGCIRLTNWDAAQLADMVKPGTPAILKD